MARCLTLRFREILTDTEVEQIKVDGRTLDRLINEYDALMGNANALPNRPVTVFEFNPSAPTTFSSEPNNLLDLSAEWIGNLRYLWLHDG